MSADLFPLETIIQRIAMPRGKKILLDADPTMLYGVPTKRFNEQVGRIPERFPFRSAKKSSPLEAALCDLFILDGCMNKGWVEQSTPPRRNTISDAWLMLAIQTVSITWRGTF